MMAGIRAWWRDEEPSTRFALLAIVAVGALARLAALGQPMRYDESVTYLYFVGRSWRTAVSAYQFPNNHLLYTVAAKLMALLGHGAPWSLRLPAFVAGVATIPLTYALGRALYTRGAALIGAALVAAAMPLILYSANARGYAWIIAAYLILMLIAARIRADGATPRRWAAFALVAAAGLATIPVMLYPLGAVALWFAFTQLVEHGTGARPMFAELAGALAAAGALALVAYLPIIHVNGLAALTANKFVTASPWPQFYAQLIPNIVLTFSTWAQPYPLLIASLLAGIAVVGIFSSVRGSNEGVSVVLAAYVWSAVLLVVNHRVPFSRTWLWMLPIVALAVGSACDHALTHPRVRRVAAYLPGLAVAIAAFGVAWGFATDAIGRSTDTGLFAAAQPIAQALATRVRPGDRVLAPIPSNAPLQYYMLRAGADTALLSTPDSLTTREIIVLNRSYGQTVPWAIAVGMVDTAHFGPVAPAMSARDGDVFVAERKARAP
ncbi:MAG TPA: glycosyltransferase family 39 protein [Gemmatimonadaceae bacterium]